MNCGFIIKLSGRKISFFYNKSEKDGLFPFEGNRRELPLAILKEKDKLSFGEAALKAYQTSSKDAFVNVFEDAKLSGTFSLNGEEHTYGELLLLAIEEHISAFMQQAYLLQGKTYEGLKPELPIGFLFNDCVTDADQEYVMQMFESHGYGNVEKIDFNTYLFSNFSTPHVLVVSGDGHDIALRLYDREQKKVMRQHLIPGVGVDPRVKAVAEMFFDNLTPAGASKEKALPKLKLEAENVLESNPADYEGHITIDGVSFEFFAMRWEVNNAAAVIANSAENFGIAEFLHDAGIDMDECSIMVSPSLVANTYFHKSLKGAYPDSYLIDDAMDKEVQKSIDRRMRECDFDMHQLSNAGSDIPIDIPTENQTDSSITILGNKMAKKDIKGEPHSSSLFFKITVPKDARYVEISRRISQASKESEQLITRVVPTFDVIEEDGEQKRVIVPTEFEDTDLEKITSYTYNFVAVYFNEFGHESHTRDLELNYRTVPDVVTHEKPITVVIANDDEKSATLKWTLPKRAKLRLFFDDNPYALREGSPIANELDIAGTELPIDNNKQQYIIRKDFQGERYILPVTVRNGSLVAGKVIVIDSNPQPLNVRSSYIAVTDAIRVEWIWNNLRSVQVVWQYKDDNPIIVEVQRSGEEVDGNVEVAQHPRKSNVDIEVRSFYINSEGTSVIGKPVKNAVTNIPLAKVVFQEILDEGKNKYSYYLSLIDNVRVPCDLRLLIKEGNTDYGTPDKRIDIKREQWVDGIAQKQFDYIRKNSSEDLNFRIVSADESYTERLDFISEEKTIEGISVPPPPPPHKLRNLFILMVFVASAFFVWKIWGGQHKVIDEPGWDGKDTVLFNSIKFEKPEVILTKGKSEIINLHAEPTTADEDIEWTSDNNCVEISRNGKTGASIRADKVGKARITAKTAQSNLEASIYVTVEDNIIETPPLPPPPEDVLFSSIKFDKTDLQLRQGETVVIGLYTVPVKADENIVWYSDNGCVEFLRKDKTGASILAQNVGKAKIKASTEKSHLVAYINVTVSPRVVPPPPPPPTPSTVLVNFKRPTRLVAHIYIDGEEVGTSPWSGTLDKGTDHKVEVKLERPGRKKLAVFKGTWTFRAPSKVTIPIDPAPFE